MTQDRLDELKTELLDRIAGGGIDGVDLKEVMDELVTEEREDYDDLPEAYEMAADELRAEGRITDEGCSGCRLSYGEFAERLIDCEGSALLRDRDAIIRVLRGRAS